VAKMMLVPKLAASKTANSRAINYSIHFYTEYFLAVPQYSPNNLILTVVGSCPRFTTFLEVASIDFSINSFLKICSYLKKNSKIAS
jgi:hypothetical protein